MGFNQTKYENQQRKIKLEIQTKVLQDQNTACSQLLLKLPYNILR
jgi:hypothetical protein